MNDVLIRKELGGRRSKSLLFLFQIRGGELDVIGARLGCLRVPTKEGL